MVLSDKEYDELKAKLLKDICEEMAGYTNTKFRSYESLHSFNQTLTFASAEEQFRKRNKIFDKKELGIFAQDGTYNNLALLLSDQGNSTIKLASFDGDNREFSGSLLKQMEELYAYLDGKNKTKQVFSGLYRQEIKDYPDEAIREALVNAFIHRDYSEYFSTLIKIHADRIVIVNIGGLPKGFNVNDIMIGISACRNPQLADVFNRLELAEEHGTGIARIMNAYSGNKVKPKIEVTSHAFKITLPNCNAETVSDNNDNSYESIIIKHIKERKYVSRREIDDILGVSQSTANRILKRMAKDGLIRQVGNGNTTRYIIR